MNKLEDLFEHQLKDLCNAENQLLKAFPKMAKAANDSELKKAFKNILKKPKPIKKDWKRFVKNWISNLPEKFVKR